MRIQAALALCLLLTSCATGPMGIPEGSDPRLTAADAVKVSLSQADKDRVDRYVMAFGTEYRYGVATGPVWRKGFIGKDGDPVFKIESAELRQTLAGAGFTSRYTYTVTGELAYHGRAFPITATGSRAAAMAMTSAMRQAVELAVVDAANQSRRILDSNDR